ncbi:hypothetical protein NW762_005068 [Fusarium torreyae]|uniref:Uncharacterized protein n=1 Tax=Fusarium torreyae TaxID=1237075 RepID=A0A9W8S5T8_9HYPO|nr:hypothetical protein NW762_005068 [Fusarium torreyae]
MPPDMIESDPSDPPASSKTEPLACVSCRAPQVEDYLKEVNKNSSEEKTDDDSPLHPTQPEMNFIDVDFTSGLPQAPGNLTDPTFSTFTSPSFAEHSNDNCSPFNAQLMSLGMSEPLPPDDAMEEL